MPFASDPTQLLRPAEEVIGGPGNRVTALEAEVVSSPFLKANLHGVVPRTRGFQGQAFEISGELRVGDEKIA